ncbi:2783_t:CDS:10 [Ambispora gerdemannii]|uniref:2783_t:CDS:1 n=1 Tax=Ambispora gerdemannii TaxID=144530 RepID=A0A9N9BC90_9GLOM|nr:2783_t:CDS:10 [Ambispora gerdemannii]
MEVASLKDRPDLTFDKRHELYKLSKVVGREHVMLNVMSIKRGFAIDIQNFACLLNSQLREEQFCFFFKKLPQKSENTIRLFESSSGDYYSVHGEDALYIAQNVYKTSSVIKYFGGNVKKGIPSCTLSRLAAESFLRNALLNEQMKVEIWRGEPRKNVWRIIKQASPGNLQEFEDLLFNNVEISTSPIVLGVKLGTKGGQKIVGVAFADASIRELGSMIIQLGVKECIIPASETDYELSKIKGVLDKCGVVITEQKKGDFSNKDIEQDLNRLLANGRSVTTLPEFELKNALGACAAIIKYLSLLTDESNFGHYILRHHDLSQYMKLDVSAVRALNLMPGPQDGSNKTMSLFGLLNKCKTAQGVRLMCQWLKQPLMDIKEIEQRQTLVETFLEDMELRQSLREEAIKSMPDLHRLAKRFQRGVASLQDVVRVYQVIIKLPALISVLENNCSINDEHKELLELIYIVKFKEFMEQLDKMKNMVETTIDLEAVENHHYIIKPEFDSELQEIRDKMDQIMDELKKEHYKIGDDLNLDVVKKLRFEKTTAYGYCFRLTRNDAACVRRNKKHIELTTQRTGVFFTTTKVKELNQNFSEFAEEYEKKQSSLVKEVIEIAATYCPILETLNGLLAHLDVLLSFAHVSINAPIPYVRPKISEKGSGHVLLKGARHPCLEVQADVSFIPNDVELIQNKSEFLIITGPNMGGKSTYIRQIGVIALMAQVGCFVPCSEADICIFDCILARVGAGDSQLKGISTFMAEMLETATILKTATAYSLIIIDELGRGTSTYDGFGLAWSISEYIAKQIRCFSLFATHFHELTALADELSYVRNLHVTAEIGTNSEGGRDITLLYRVIEGVCDESFGIHVAELANFPETVVKLARWKANELEDFSTNQNCMEIDNENVLPKPLSTSKTKSTQTEIEHGNAIISNFLREVADSVDINNIITNSHPMKYDTMLEKLRGISEKYSGQVETSPWCREVIAEF